MASSRNFRKQNSGIHGFFIPGLFAVVTDLMVVGVVVSFVGKCVVVSVGLVVLVLGVAVVVVAGVLVVGGFFLPGES